MDLSNFKDPLDELYRLKKAFAPVDLLRQSHIDNILKPYDNLSKIITDVYQPTKDIKSYFDVAFINPLNQFQEQFNSLNVLTSSIIDASSFSKNILLPLNQYQDFYAKEFLIPEKFDIKKSLPNLFQPIENVISERFSEYLKADIKSIFQNGIIDFSTNVITAKSFRELSNLLETLDYDGRVEGNTVRDNLNIVLNSDYGPSFSDDTIVPAVVLDAELSRLNNFFSGFTSWTSQLAEDFKTHFRVNRTTYIVMVVTGFFTYYQNMGLNKLHGIDGDKALHSTVNKNVKVKPNESSFDVGILEPGTEILKLGETQGDWIEVEFINKEGKFKRGWIQNGDLQK